jgi:MFS family permease
MIFIPDMVIQRLGFTIAESGGAVGLMSAAFSFGNFLTASLWGYLSDVYGRKPVILFGITACGVLVALFGFSGTMAVAVSNRFAEGIVNSNYAITAAYLSDLTRKAAPEQRKVRAKPATAATPSS